MEKLNPCKILVIDDNQEMTKLCEVMLASIGAEVTCAYAYEKAVEILNSSSPDIVLCDVFLNDKFLGTDLMKQYLHRTPQMVFVMMTDMWDIKTAIDCLRDGAYDFLLKPFNLVGLHKAIKGTLQRQATQIEARSQVESRMRMLAEFSDNNPNPILRIAMDGKVMYSNFSALKHFPGWSVMDDSSIPPEILENCREVIRSKASRMVEHDEGDDYWDLNLIPAQKDEATFIFAQNTTARRLAEEDLFRAQAKAIESSLHDPLTGLPNRRLFEQRTELFMERIRQSGRKAGLAIVDLDNFKEINDFFGHKAGDRVLQRIGDDLRKLGLDEELICRWGGDEFVAFLEGPDRESIEKRCREFIERLSKVLRELYPLHLLSISIGLAFFPEDGTTSDLLMQRADHALYTVKSRGKNGLMSVSDADRH